MPDSSPFSLDIRLYQDELYIIKLFTLLFLKNLGI